MSPPFPPCRRLRAAVVALLIVAGLTAPGRAEEGDEAVARAREAWQHVRRDDALGPRLRAATALARTQRPEALEALLDIYRKPGTYPEHFRELVAPILAQEFGGPAFAREFLTILRTKLREPEHAWLAWQVFRRWVGTPQELYVQLAARAFVDQPYHRAAALDALAEEPSARGLEVARVLLETLPDDEPARSLLGEAAANLWLRGLAAGGKEIRAADLEPVLVLLDDEDATSRTRRWVARELARLLASDVVWLDGASWRQWLEDRRAAERLAADGYATGNTPTFLGVRARGRDVCYVIDVSGSMNMPIGGVGPRLPTAPESPRGPATGRPAPGSEAPAEEAPPDAWEGLEDLPWSRIRTRLDLVREALKASLQALAPDQHFAIVTFSSDAMPLSLTRSPKLATPRNVERACRALDALSASGSTNLHRGIELAFAYDDRGLDDDGAFQDERHLESGFDTIFLLTDGVPNVDSYGSHTVAGALYAATPGLLLATERRNLFRRAEINCIGMGSSPRALLRKLADVGGGRARFLGQ